MTVAQIEAGTLTANLEERVVSGLLLPYGELGNTNLGKFSIDRGAVTLPRDHSVVMANVGHQREHPVGPATSLNDTDEGVVATFKIADTDEGDQLLLDISEGKLTKLSAEIRNVVLRAGKAVSGVLFGAAFVEQGAFPSAALMAEDAGDIEDVKRTRGITDAEVQRLRDLLDTIAAERAALDSDEAPASEATNEETETPVTTSAPNTLEAAATVTPSAPSKDEILSLIASAKNGSRDADTLLAALSDIKVSGSGALPAAGVLQPSWLGELWQGRSYVRKYMPLITNGSIRAIDEKGFVITGTESLVAAWNGNKAELPTGTASTSVKSSTFQRWGYAADIAREFFDIPGNEEVINAFLSKLANSYARVTDIWTLAQLVAAATPGITAPDTYPTEYPDSLGMLIQGIETVEDAGDTPSFAIANAKAWTELLYTPKDQVPEFVSFAFGTNFEGVADGRIRVVKGDLGIDDTPAILVGSKAAAHVNELPGASPLNLDALDIAHGGIDRAVVGYSQFMADFPAGLALVGAADE